MEKEKLYYTDGIPAKVHIVSDKLMLNHFFEPIKLRKNTIYLSDLFELCNNPVFDVIGVLFEPDNHAYIKSINDKIQLNEWLNLKNFDGIPALD